MSGIQVPPDVSGGSQAATGWADGGPTVALVTGSDNVTLGTGTFTTQGPVINSRDDASTNTVLNIQTLARTTSGTAASGLGLSTIFQLEDSAGNTDNSASIEVSWADATSTSEDSQIIFKTIDAGGSLQERFRVTNTGIRAIDDAGTILFETGRSGNDRVEVFSLYANSGAGDRFALLPQFGSFTLSSDYIIKWQSGANWFSGTNDLSLLRDTISVLKVTDGSTGLGSINALLAPVVNDAVTSADSTVGTFTHTTTGTAANGIGVKFLFKAEDSAGNTDDAGALCFRLSNATSGAEATEVAIQTRIGGGAIGDSVLINGSGRITSGGLIATANGVEAPATGWLGHSNRSTFYSPSDGVFEMTNWAATDFNRLQFGGTSVAFPALARSTDELHCKYADNSNFAVFKAHGLRVGAGQTTGTALNEIKLNNTSASTTGLKMGTYGLYLGSSLPIAWTTDPDGVGPDVAFVRTAANDLSLTNASSGMGTLLTKRKVTNHTSSPVSVLVTSSRNIFTNAGATGSVTFNLPGAEAGAEFGFAVAANQTFVVTAASGDFIIEGSSSSTSGGSFTSTQQYSFLKIVAIDTTTWVVTNLQGAWTPS